MKSSEMVKDTETGHGSGCGPEGRGRRIEVSNVN